MAFVHQALLAVSVVALADGGFRLASLAATGGLERVVATATLAAAAATLEALLLGLIGLGTEPLALAPAAAVTWLAAWRLLPSPQIGAREELAGWWRDTPSLRRLALASLAGVALAWSAWLLRFPALGVDSLLYHVPEVIEWVHNGRPGSVGEYFPFFSVGNYPATNEVLLAWGSGIGRSFLWIGIWAPATTLLLGVAGWTGRRSLRVDRLVAGLAVGALCLTPVLTHWQMNGAHTHLPALAWLVSAGALCAASATRPALLAPAIVAAGLAIGTKTTTLPIALLALAFALYANRIELRRLAVPLALAAGTALAVGGDRYLRNFVDHGEPFWPPAGETQFR